MTKQEKCNKILKLMQEAGFDVVDQANNWSEDDMDYFLVNYEEPYLGPSEDPMGDGDIPKVWP